MQPHEDGLDEVLMLHNPKGGRPQRVGKMVFLGMEPTGGFQEVSDLKEETEIRYNLGYCVCSRKIVIGRKRAMILAERFRQNRIEPRRVPVRVRLARMLINTSRIANDV